MKIEVLLPPRVTAAEAQRMIDECSADLRQLTAAIDRRRALADIAQRMHEAMAELERDPEFKSFEAVAVVKSKLFRP